MSSKSLPTQLLLPGLPSLTQVMEFLRTKWQQDCNAEYDHGRAAVTHGPLVSCPAKVQVAFTPGSICQVTGAFVQITAPALSICYKAAQSVCDFTLSLFCFAS